MVERSRSVRRFDILWIALAFGISYGQYALFYHTQNQYFFHGLARVGLGQLQNDWFARTPDPWPVFTSLVELTYRYLDPRFFYLYFIALLGIYAISLFGITSVLFRIDSSRLKYLAFAVLFVALHSPLFGYLSRMVFGLPMVSSPHHFNIGRILLLEGVGEKRILGDMLNPGTFGVFLLLSILLFLRGRSFLAVAMAALAATIQPSYVLLAGILALAYMIIMARRGEGLRRSLGLGTFALGLVLPLVAYSYVAFRPTDPAVWKESQDILWRIAYYPPSVPALWLGMSVFPKVGLILVAGYLVRRTPLFLILLLLFVTASGLTVLQMLTDSNTLAALLPWRISALLMPLATVIIIGYVVSRSVDRFEPYLSAARRSLIATLSAVSMIVLVFGGAIETKRRFDLMSEAKMPGVMRFVQATKAPGQTYLIPPNWRGFRLFTQAPAFAERSVIPYNDVGVMDWYKRVRLAEAFYGAVESDREDDHPYQRTSRRTRALRTSSASSLSRPTPEERCRVVHELEGTYHVTHVIVKGADLEGCRGWRSVFDDGAYRLYAVNAFATR